MRLTLAHTSSSLRRNDQQGAAELLSRTLPDAGRLPQHALRILAKNALRHACKLVSEPSDTEGPPKQSVPAAAINNAESHNGTVLPANSNDLLPSIRPKVPSSQATRKRRRVSRVGAEDAFATRSYKIGRPLQRFRDVGGISGVLDTITELVEWPLVHVEVYEHLGVDPPRGILLHGPPGCGKTLLAHAIAGELGVTFFRVSGPEIVSGMSGESERKLRELFAEAERLEPSIIFVDEIDAIASRREGASKEMERRIVSQLLSCVDNLSVAKSTEPSPSDGREEAATNETDLNQCSRDAQMNDISPGQLEKAPSVVVIAATNRPESLEPALRRAGRFDREIELGAPDEDSRAEILSTLCRDLRVENGFNLMTLAKRTAGYVGADLHLLIKEAGLACVRRFATAVRPKTGLLAESSTGDGQDLSKKRHGSEYQQPRTSPFFNEESHTEPTGEVNTTTDQVQRQLVLNDICDDSGSKYYHREKWSQQELENCMISMFDFEIALKTIQPSALREGFATRPNVSWDNVGAMEAVREEMIMAIVEPIRRPEMFSSLGLHAPAGVLLYGPPGCGKTLLARAVASESGANFISVKGPELLSKYVGDSELAVRKVFQRARSSAPCVIFFDELDALAPRRGSGGGESSGASERVVNMLLTEMDGFSERKQVFLVAATNRPDIIDPAMLRPGRLDKLVYVPLPNAAGRVSILKTLLRGVKLGDDIDVEKIAGDKACDGFSGADLQALIRVAGENALRECMKRTDGTGDVKIENRHFVGALNVVLPSVSQKDATLYRSMEGWLRKTRSTLKNGA